MKRPAIALMVMLLAGCGGGGHSSAPGTSSLPASPANTQSGTMSLTFGSQTGTSAVARKPLFVSPNATTANVSINSGTSTPFDVSATSALCQTVSSVRTCAIPLNLPFGQDQLTVSLMGTVSGNSVLLGQGSNSLTVVSGTSFSVAVGVNPMVAGINSGQANLPTSYSYGTASSNTASITFADPSGANITGSGNVPNFLTPVTLTSSDPHFTITPATLTTPGQTFTVAYDGSAAVAQTVTITAGVGTFTLASVAVNLPGLLVTRYNLAAVSAYLTIVPYQITVGPDQHIWWVERDTNKIGTITPGQSPSAPITHYPSGFVTANLTGIAAGTDGTIWFSDGNQHIGRMTTSGGVPGSGPSQILIGAPGSQIGRLALDSQGNVWFLNSGAGFSQVGYVDETTYTVHTFGSTPTANSLQSFGGLTLGADNAMWFTEYSATTQQIGRITTPANGVAGTYTEYPDPNSSLTVYPTDMTKGPDGKVWFSEFASNANNQFFANFVPGVTISINEFPNVINPNAFANLVTIFTGADGNVWMAEGGGAVRINPASPSTPVVQFFTDDGQTSMINCISGATPDGNLWCSAYGGPALGQGFIPTADAILTWKPR